MSKTKIEWCARPGTLPETWNPTTGCDKVSQGCKNCYAEIMHKRLQGMYALKYDHPFLGTVKTHVDTLSIPFTWKTPRTVFVNSMSDLFHEKVSSYFINGVFAVMALCPQHTFQILTKRPERMKQYFSELDFDDIHGLVNLYHHKFIGHLESELHFIDEVKNWFPLKNVWLGTSVEDQTTAELRVPLLLQVPAAVRFLSCEPLLGPIDFSTISMYRMQGFINYLDNGYKKIMGIDWVIAGGESGHYARPMHPDWVRCIRDQCASGEVPFFFKQWGEWAPDEKSIRGGRVRNKMRFDQAGVHMTKVGKHLSGRLLDGKEYNEFPKVREGVEA